jgi:glucose-1-phosphate thymidylyltransferase
MIDRKGIVLAGGSGTRLYPSTKVISKQLMPIYDKPMVYYPLSILMLSNIRNILIISTPSDTPIFQKLLNDGSQWGVNIQYAIQEKPRGLAESFIIGKNFIGNNLCTMILGDNIFYGHQMDKKLKIAHEQKVGASIFAYRVNDPQYYGVANFDKKKVIDIEEKPKIPKSNYAVTGLYYYDQQVCDIASSLTPSKRGELEITDVNNFYIKKEQLSVNILDRGITWLDTGTYDGLLEASSFVSTIQKRQGLQISCLEEIAYKKKWISSNDLEKIAHSYRNNSYGQYLLKLL